MTIGSIGKVIANQAIETTKNSVIDAVRQPDPKSAESRTAGTPDPVGTAALITAQINAMQRPLKEDQELVVTVRTGEELLRVTDVFVPNQQILVFAGVDKDGNVTRLISPAEAAQVTCRILSVAPGFSAVRVNVLTPKPPPKPAA